MTVKIAIVICLSSWLYLGCSSCSESDDHDTGTTDSDTDSDSDSDTESDIDAGPIITSDAGPWDWEDLPEGEDCGEGCVQLTFSEEVRSMEWDVWEDLLVFKDETTCTRVINLEKKKQLLLPGFYPEYEVGPALDASTFSPATIHNQTVCYSMNIYEGNNQSTLICADLEAEIQTLIYIRHEQFEISPNPAKYIDVYENHIVAMGGCGDLDSWPLCNFDTGSPNTYTELASHFYGSHNSIWGDIVVWYSPSSSSYDIRGYDIDKQEAIAITDDAATQLFPRIHEGRVVYQDLKFGTSDGMGDWNHSAVFMHDIGTGKKTQITNAEWIAAYPDIQGNIIIWADYRDSADPNSNTSFSGVEIWGYNLDTQEEFQITNLPGRSKTMPRIWGNKVFVDMLKEDSYENAIYMFDLPEDAYKQYPSGLPRVELKGAGRYLLGGKGTYPAFCSFSLWIQS